MSYPEPPKRMRAGPVLRTYTKAALRYPGSLALTMLAAIGMQAASIVVPLYLKQLIDLLSSNSPSPEVTQALLAILVAYIALGGLNWLSRNLHFLAVLRIEANVMADLANKAYAYLLGHSYDFFTSNFTGTLTRRVTRFSRAFEQVYDVFAINLFPTFLFATGSIYVLFLRNHWLGIVLLVWVIVFIVVQLYMTRWLHPLRTARTAEDSKMTGILSDAIGNHSAIKLFAAEKSEWKIFADVIEAWRSATRRLWKADSIMRAVQQALAILIEVALLGTGVLLWNQGVVTVGDFILIQVYVLGLIDMGWNVGHQFRRLYDAFADASEMIEVMETPYGVKDAPDAVPLSVTRGEIAFDTVSFYFNEQHPVLERYSLTIHGGEKIALVGPSGAGKTTVTKLLLRLYDVSGGSIKIDGQDLRNLTQESLHRAVSFVPQEPVLFHRTLRENIAYGKPGASDEEVIRAAKGAHCHEFISKLPQGYDTYVGERGIKLSGGERQRIAIARAILKNAPILVLDEATSSLDSESEALIQEALAKLMEGKTVIAIAHRLSTIMKMDRIIVMDGGKAILSGTHAELLNQGSNLYKKLWEIQAGGFLQDENILEKPFG